MPLMQYCSNCWAENLMGATVCERCGTPLSETEPIFYDQKLMRALHHPIPETREMAAMLLGQRKDRHALPVLISRHRRALRHQPGSGTAWGLPGRHIACKASGATACTRGGTDYCRCPGNARPKGMLGGPGRAQSSTSCV